MHANEFQGFMVVGKCIWKLALTVTPISLAEKVKLGYTLNQSHHVHSCGTENAQNYKSLCLLFMCRPVSSSMDTGLIMFQNMHFSKFIYLCQFVCRP